ncbi:MAG: chemotaxis protein CheW [Myxococcales bacterium]|nr:chemotaxis protein CheW [Myxococcales bacterium]
MADELRNVIVFTLAGARHAAELRWVREVITLGFVTSVPTAPPGIAGAFNHRGHLVPVLDIAALGHAGASGQPRQGDSALLVEIDGVTAALRVDKVEEVATLPVGTPTSVVDGRGRTIALIDPPALVRQAIAEANAVRGDDPEDAPVLPRDPTTGARLRVAFDGDTTLG